MPRPSMDAREPPSRPSRSKHEATKPRSHEATEEIRRPLESVLFLILSFVALWLRVQVCRARARAHGHGHEHGHEPREARPVASAPKTTKSAPCGALDSSLTLRLRSGSAR